MPYDSSGNWTSNQPDYITDILGTQPNLGSSNFGSPVNNGTNSTNSGMDAGLTALQKALKTQGIAQGIAGDLGNVIGIGGGLAMDIFQKQQGQKKINAANNLFPPLNDPMEAQRLSQLDKMRKKFQTGTMYNVQLEQLKNIQSNTNQGILRAGGGDRGATLSALKENAINTGDEYGKIAAQGESRMDAYDKEYGDLLSRMAQRRAELQMQKYTQTLTSGEEEKKAGEQGLSSFISQAPKLLPSLIPLIAAA